MESSHEEPWTRPIHSCKKHADTHVLLSHTLNSMSVSRDKMSHTVQGYGYCLILAFYHMERWQQAHLDSCWTVHHIATSSSILPMTSCHMHDIHVDRNYFVNTVLLYLPQHHLTLLLYLPQHHSHDYTTIYSLASTSWIAHKIWAQDIGLISIWIC